MKKNLTEIVTRDFLLKEHVENGKTIREIAREVGCSHTNIRKYFKKHGIESSTSLFENQYGRKIVYNDKYFDTIDSEEKAYWFGFLYGDGYIHKTKKQMKLRLSLAQQDEDHLSLFAKTLGELSVSHQVLKTGYRPGEISPFVDVSSTHLCRALEEKGMTTPKKDRFGLPSIPDDFFFAFLHGLFDADGSIVLQKKWATVSLLGHEQLIHFLKSRLINEGYVFHGENIFELQNIFRLSFSANQNIEKLYDSFYTGRHPFLARKKEKFDQYFLSKI